MKQINIKTATPGFIIVPLTIIMIISGCNSIPETETILDSTQTPTVTFVRSESAGITTETPEFVQTPIMEPTVKTKELDDYAGVDPNDQLVIFWHTLKGEQESALLNLVNDFNTTNDWGIIVEPSYQGENEDIKEKILSVINTTDSPSLIIANEAQAAAYQLKDALVNINHLVNNENWGLTQPEILDFFPGILDKGTISAFNHNRLTYPIYGQMNLLYYNLDWLLELGYSTSPTNPQSFLDASCLAAVQPFSGATAFGRRGAHLNLSPESFFDWSLAFGGKVFEYGENQYIFDSKNNIDAMTFLQSLVERGCGLVDLDRSSIVDVKNGFSKGILLFVIDSAEKIPNYRSSIQEEANFNWQVTAFPHTTNQPTTNLQITSASILKTTPQEELAAWIFLKFLSNPNTQTKWIRMTNTLPLRQETVSLLDEYYSKNSAGQMTLALINNSYQEPFVPGSDEAQPLINNALYEILRGAEVRSTLTNLSQEVNLLLDKQAELISEVSDPWADVDPNGQSIAFWHQQDPERSSLMENIINEFNDNNKWGITVLPVVHQDYGEIFQNLIPVLNTTDVPGIVLAYQHHAAAYHEAGGLIDQSSLLDSRTWGLPSEELEDFYQPILRQDQFGFYDSARLGFPIQRSTDILYYNLDLLSELGYQAPPTNPAEFKDMACAASEHFEASGIGGDGYQLYLDATRFSSWVFAFDGDIFDKNQNQFLFDGFATSSTLTFLNDLIVTGCADIVTERVTSQEAFGQGSLLFLIDSSFHLTTIADLVTNSMNFNWSVAPLPTVSEYPIQNLFGASLSIPKSTPEKELAAWLFIKYFTEPKVQAKWVEGAGYLPVRAGAEDYLQNFFKTSSDYKIIFDLLPFGKTEPSLPGYDFIHQEIELALQMIFLSESEESELEEDSIDLAEILDSLNGTVNQILLIHLE